MACIGMAYIIMAYIVVACMSIAYIVLAYIVLACIVLAYVDMIYIVMAAVAPWCLSTYIYCCGRPGFGFRRIVQDSVALSCIWSHRKTHKLLQHIGCRSPV